MSNERPTNAERLAALEAHMGYVRQSQQDTHEAIDRLAETTRTGMETMQQRLATMNLNGSAEAIKRIAKLEPGLTTLATNAEALAKIAADREDKEKTKKTLKRWFHIKLLGRILIAIIEGGVLLAAIEFFFHIPPLGN